MHKLEPELNFSYGQFLIYDSKVESPGCDWTEVHTNQGFARRDGVISIATLLVFGKSKVKVFLDNESFDVKNYERVHMIPLTVKSGEVIVEAVDESGTDRKIEVPAGFYEVTIAQKLLGDEEEVIDIFFEETKEESQESKILLADAGLNPPETLIEMADIA